MNRISTPKHLLRIHLTNVAGLGASQLLQSLLPMLESVESAYISELILPNRGALAVYTSKTVGVNTRVYRRYLPNSISRVLECTILAQAFNDSSPILVFGDIPLRCKCSQTVFFHNSNLLNPARWPWQSISIKAWVSQLLFSYNVRRAKSFIVQSELMRMELEKSYPRLLGKVHVIPQPVPSWLLSSGLKRLGQVGENGRSLRLVYPAANYAHKNHGLLSLLDQQRAEVVDRLILTINPIDNPAPRLDWIECAGFLSPAEMINCYADVDALLFLSTTESYGFPLLEAMFVGLPIVCPDLPYARTLCGTQGIYFDPDDPASLQDALEELKQLLDDGWWPCWQEQLKAVPADWETVAEQIVNVAVSSV